MPLLSNISTLTTSVVMDMMGLVPLKKYLKAKDKHSKHWINNIVPKSDMNSRYWWLRIDLLSLKLCVHEHFKVVSLVAGMKMVANIFLI